MLRKLGRRSLASSLLGAVTIAAAVLTSPASPATASTHSGSLSAPALKIVKLTPKMRADAIASMEKGQTFNAAASVGLVGGVHACKDLGNDGTTHGVVCADMYAATDSDGVDVDVFPGAEAVCQNSGGATQCADVKLTINVDFGDGFQGTKDLEVCGHSNGSCASGDRNYWVGPDGYRIPRGGGAGTASDVWTVIWPGSDIELPGSAKFVTLPGTFGSQHHDF